VNRLSTARRAQVVRALVEGNSVRSTVRITGVAKNTVTKLLVDLGNACAEYQDGAIQNVNAKRVQADEIWSYCHAKQKNVPEEHQGEPGYGDIWTWVAIDADTKLVVTYFVGDRSRDDCELFMLDLASRVTSRIQLTTDALAAYVPAVRRAFGDNIDFAQQSKEIIPDNTERRYSPPKYRVVETIVRTGDPDRRHISTSYVERNNLTIRMGMRRFTRLTNAFSKKIENLAAAVSLHFMHYNFCRVHQTLGVTPAMAAGISDHAWSGAEICQLLETAGSQAESTGCR
jgi:IS1 family transposase